MAVLTQDDLITAFKSMTLSELSGFRKLFEDTFDVTAAMPAAAVPAQPEPASAPAEEQDEFDVILEAAGDRKIQVIKEVRALAGLGLKDSKDVVESAPVAILKAVSKEAAAKAVAVLAGAGATAAAR